VEVEGHLKFFFQITIAFHYKKTVSVDDDSICFVIPEGWLKQIKSPRVSLGFIFGPHCARASSACPVFWGLLPSVVIPRGGLNKSKDQVFLLALFFRSQCARASTAHPVFWGYSLRS